MQTGERVLQMVRPCFQEIEKSGGTAITELRQGRAHLRNDRSSGSGTDLAGALLCAVTKRSRADRNRILARLSGIWCGSGSERTGTDPGLAMAAYTAFLDVALGFGTPVLGLLAAVATLGAAFVASAVAALCGWHCSSASPYALRAARDCVFVERKCSKENAMIVATIAALALATGA